MQVVKVRLRKPRRVFSFLCDGITLHRDDPCVVQTDRGTEWGVCILPPEPCPDEMARRFNMKVLRRASRNDTTSQESLESEERKAHRVCFDKIKQRKLPMKLVDAEYTFDKRKVVFYFTAEDRVDFRELVRDLAHDLRTRIELRHIQVRDEAKMVGGIGSCGRALCCTTWLNEFKPISMRMAKRQNLSLNPSKISGQCGRLLCCLAYENDQYETFKRRSRESAEERPQETREGGQSDGAAAEPGRGRRPDEGQSRPRRGDRRDEAPRRESRPEARAEPAEAVAAEGAETPKVEPGEGPRKRSRRRRRRPGKSGDAS